MLEIGCGCGLVGLLAGQLGARRVVLSDCNDETLGELQQLVQLPEVASSSCSFEVGHLGRWCVSRCI